jgi:exodeoxyribonuclease-3
MKLLSWNVNGLRAVSEKGFLPWLERSEADVVCLQEIKAHPEQVPPSVREPQGFEGFWNPARKPGYSGVAIFSRIRPLTVTRGFEQGAVTEAFDSEGRVLTAEYSDFFLVNAYFPNSQRDHARLPFKLEFCSAMDRHLHTLRSRGKAVILCGDWNICHREIDLRNPKQNENNAGFLPQERAWIDSLLKSGWRDAFRQFEPGGGHYTWWSYRPGVREKNIGWRLDYHVINEEHVGRLRRAWHEPNVLGSDHCPVGIELS